MYRPHFTGVYMQTKKMTILIVDDDPEVTNVLKKYLEDDGYAIHVAANAAESRAVVSQKSFDLILLDMILPDADGLSLMGELKSQQKIPIIVVSGKTDATDRIIGLELGADDYVTKPFHMRELSARIKSVIRRTVLVAEKSQEAEKSNGKAEVFSFGNWIMNCGKYEVSNDAGESMLLTSGEFELLRVLINSPNRVLKREQLFEMTRGMDCDSYDRAIDIQIGRLRKKLSDDPHTPSLIKTVRGVGYMFIGDVRKSAVA